MGLTPEVLVAALRQAGFTEVGPDTTLLELARSRHTSPQRLLARILPAAPAAPGEELPQTPPPGTGSLRLDALCQRSGLTPVAVYAVIRQAAAQTKP